MPEPLPEYQFGDDWFAVAEQGLVRLPDPPYTPVLSRGLAYLVAALDLLPLIYLFGPLLLMPWVIGDLGPPPKEGTVSLTHVQTLEMWALVAVSVHAPMVSILFDLSGPANRLLRRRAWRIIARRSDLVVRPDEKSAHFVELVPRENRHRSMLESATDVGFLRVDTARGVVFYEGGNERWFVRGKDIVYCDVETLRVGIAFYFFVVIEVDTPGPGTRVRCFATRHSGKVLLGWLDRRWALELMESIGQIRRQARRFGM